MRVILLALACLGTLAGCATGTGSARPAQETLPIAPELDATPFFPQQAYQCGPAALATLLGASGIPVTPEELAPAVYVPDRRGSLQAELLGASRRYGRMPYPAGRTFKTLASHLRDGRPVLVLQNLGFRRFPIWHYAVVVGFDPEADRVILRSGTHRRHVISRKDFATSWDRADRWAIVLLAPGEMPLEADETAYLRAVSGLEAAGKYRLAKTGYEAALMAWPGSETGLLGIAFVNHQLGNYAQAEHALRQLLSGNPTHAIAWNNLAEVLRQRGCAAQASAAVDTAIRLAPQTLRAEFAATRADIQNHPAPQDPAETCQPVPAAH